LGVRSLSGKGPGNTDLTPVFCNRRLVGYLTGRLPEWDQARTHYRLGRSGGTDKPGTDTTPIHAATIFDSLKRAIALEVQDASELAGWAEFRYLDE
jgi:hypothetical protein